MSNTNLKPSELRPWMKYFPEESVKMEMPYRTIYRALCEGVEEHPDANAIYYYGTRWTYRELLNKVDNMANAYYAMGVRPGDMVSVLAPTIPESILTLYAVNKIGGVPNFIDPRMDTERIYDAIEGVHSKLLVTLDLPWPKIAKILDRLTVEKIIVFSANDSLTGIPKLVRTFTGRGPKVPYDGYIMRWKEFLAKASKATAPEHPYEDGSVAGVTYTGGTTGTPKGVMITNDGLNTMADSFVYSGVDKKSTDRFLGIMPIFASYGIGQGVHMPLRQGIELVVIPKFTPDQLGDLIRKYHPNHMMGVPSFYEQIMHSKSLWDYDLSFLLTTGCGGDTMNPGLEERFNKFMKEHNGKYPLSQGYGLSEMSGAATCCFSNVYKDASSGIPLLATIVGIFDPETGEELGFNQQGEICMRGRNMMKGYFNNPEETHNVIREHKDGTKWVHSGDIGYMDEDGFIFIKGRIKQIIIRFDGHKVFPVSIEGVINRHKSVGHCAVVGIPDLDHAQGEVPLGIIELKSTLAEEDIDCEAIRQEIMATCNEVLEERGKPVDMVFIPEMLRTGLNKNDYRRLTELYKDYNYKEQAKIPLN
ncbi:MAG: acyl--CoA ligase [Firmicutes bacterium]|nr:acyl--CoA ligase [Bacillota bacterium]